MNNLIAVYKLSPTRKIISSVILFFMAGLFLTWWLEIENVINTILIPISFLFVFIIFHWFYAWFTREKSIIKVFENGIYFESEFINWRDVKTVKHVKTGVDTISNTLLVSKFDGGELKISLDFKNEKSDIIFRCVLNAFERSS